MGAIHYLKDGLRNLVANLGTGRDKASSSHYVIPSLDRGALINAYRGAWLPRKVVDIPANDACREWRNWNGTQSEIEALEKHEALLDVRGKVHAALITARLIGGCAVMIGTGDGDVESPLNVEGITKGGLKYLTVVTPSRISGMGQDLDPASEWYMRPEFWQLSNAQGQMLKIHPSRLVIFHGAKLPEDDPEIARGWGDSVLVSIYQALLQADSTTANIASLVFEAKVDVIRIPDLMNSLSRPEYEDQLIKRFTLAATGKSINGTLILDKEEEYEQKTAQFGTLHELMDRFYQNVSGAADIPMTRLFGRSPSGMNATGDADLRNYYDRVRAHQTLEMTPAMNRLDEVLIRSALGLRPPELHYEWTSLWQASTKELADIGKVTAETIKVLSDVGLFAPEALADAGANAMVESGSMPGLEAAIGKYGPSDEPDEADAIAAQTPRLDDSWRQRVIDDQKKPEIIAPVETLTDGLERVMKAMPAPTFNVDVKPADVTVNTPKVDVAAPVVTVNHPPIHVQAGDVHVPKMPAAQVVIQKADSPAPVVNVAVNVPETKPKVTETEVTGYDEKGRIKTTRQTEREAK